MLTGLPALRAIMNMDLLKCEIYDGAVTNIITYQSHVLVDGDQRRIFDTVLQQPHQHVEGVERKRPVDPRISVLGMVADGDSEGNVAEDADNMSTSTMQ